MAMRVCNTCGEEKDEEEEFYRDGQFYKGKCKDCYKKAQRERYSPEYQREYMREWRAKNPGYYRGRY